MVRARSTSLQSRKRAAILDGARTVFLRDGFAAGSVDDVALEAGVGKQTIYRHFGSKEALIVGLVEAMCAGAANQVSAPDAELSLEDALRSNRSREPPTLPRDCC